MDLGSEVSDEWEREGIADSLLIQRPEVRTWADPAPCLVGQVKAASPVRLGTPLDFFNNPILQHFSHTRLPSAAFLASEIIGLLLPLHGVWSAVSIL